MLVCPTVGKCKYRSYQSVLKSDTIKQNKYVDRGGKWEGNVYVPKGEKWSNGSCVFRKQYSLKQRLTQYPFSKAVKILVVSYPLQYDDQPIHDDAGKRLNPYIDTIKSGLHIKNGILNDTSLIEKKQLTSFQINKLSNLIYNISYRKRNRLISPGAKCFDPRNAIIFFNKKGEIFDYVQICFGCNNYQSFSENINLSIDCNQKFDLLKRFFIDTGIKYGTIERRDSLFNK